MKKNGNISSIVPFKKLPSTKAWKLTSLYVRKKSKGICYTCNKKFPLNKLHCGHFREKIGGAATYFDIKRNLRAQCYRCNRLLHGAKDIYAMKLLKEIGQEEIENLMKAGQKSKQWTKHELGLIEIAIKELLFLLNEKNGKKQN